MKNISLLHVTPPDTGRPTANALQTPPSRPSLPAPNIGKRPVEQLMAQMAQSLTSGQMPPMSPRQTKVSLMIQLARRRSGQWMAQGGAEMLLEIAAWELDLHTIPDEKLDEAFKLAWDSWDGRGEFNAWDVIEAWRAKLRVEQKADADARQRWYRDHPGEYRCDQCDDTGAQMVWVRKGNTWAGGARPCKCDPAAKPGWIRGSDGSWARISDVAKFGPPHRGFSYENQPTA